MNMNLETLIDGVAHVWADKGVTWFQAGCEVANVARQLGYPAPMLTGIWPSDAAPLLRVVAGRLREVTR